jgi:hypothetical protein
MQIRFTMHSHIDETRFTYFGDIGKSFGGITETMCNHHQGTLIGFILGRNGNGTISGSFRHKCTHFTAAWKEGGR